MAQPSEAQTLLGALVARENLSWEEAAEKVTRASEAHEESRPTSITARHLGRIARRERGADSRPTPALARALQFAFGRPVDELLAPYDPATLAPTTRGEITPATSEVLSMAADRARRFGSMSTASDDVVDMIHEDVRGLVQAYPNRPLPELLPHLVSGQDTVFTLLELPQRPEPGRRLYFLAGVLGGMLAKASHDLADPHAAQTQARTAWLCADQADHNGLRAWISGLQSLIAYWARRPQESIRHAQRGAPYAAVAHSTASVWLAANEGRAWAALGNTSNVQDAIARADAAWSNVAPDDLDELGGIATFSRSRQLYYAADALAWLPGSDSGVRGYAEQAVDAYTDPDDPDWAFGDAAGSRCDLAIARLEQGEIEGADEALAPVLDLPPEQRINGIVHSVNRVHSALSPFRDTPLAVALQDGIEAYTRTPAHALPR